MKRSRAAVVSTTAVAGVLVVAGSAWATPYRITEADRREIDQVLHRFFDAARDGNVEAALAQTPTSAEMDAMWQPGNEPMRERQHAAVERDVRDLRERFAGGTWVGIGTSFTAGSTVELSQCGRFTVASTQCVMGPVIEWRLGGDAGADLQHMRVDKLVRVNGHWRIWDPRI